MLNVIVSKFLFRAALPWKMPFLWLACAFIACAPGLTMVRANLLIFPMTFMALFLCSVFSEVAKRSQRGKLLVTLAMCWAVVGEAYISSVTVESFNPYSSWVINMNSIFIYGGYSKAATIPAERRASTEKQLAEVGIRSEDDMKTRLPEMIIELTAENRRIPWPANTAFVPFLHGIDEP